MNQNQNQNTNSWDSFVPETPAVQLSREKKCEDHGHSDCPSQCNWNATAQRCEKPSTNLYGAGGRGYGRGKCIGSSSVLQTPTGTVRLADAKPGDVVMTHLGPQKILHVRDHGFEACAHYRLTLSNSEEIVLTGDHLVHAVSGERVRADSLSIGDVLKGDVTVVNIDGVDDIPLTPVVAAGTVVVGGAVVSCWAQSEKNAQRMDGLMVMAVEYAKSHSVKETSAFMHRAYEMFKASNKNEEKIEEIHAAAIAVC